MSFIGKFLLLLHTLASFAILTWSLLHYTNRFNWADVVYEDGRGLEASVKHWQTQIADQQKLYAPRLDRQAQSEVDLEYRRIRIAERQAEARSGKFYNIYFNSDNLPQLADRRDDSSESQYSRSFRVIFGPLPDNRVVNGVEKMPLQSVDTLLKSLDDSNTETAATKDKISTSLSSKLQLAITTASLEIRTKRLKEILRTTDDELDVLTDSRIVWDEQLDTLTKRNRQLLTRLGMPLPGEQK